MAQQLNLLPTDVEVAIAAAARARKAKNGRIGLMQARLYDAVREELEREFPKPDAAAKSKPIAKPGYVAVVGHQRPVAAPRRHRQADQSLALSVGA